MSAIRIHPEQVRHAGLAAVTCADDLRAQAALLQSMPLPAMPAAMAGRHQGALTAIAGRLGALASEFGLVGEELQVRAAAAEAADAPGPAASASAGRQLARAVTTTVAITGAGGGRTFAKLTTKRAHVTASTGSGLRLTIPDALERPVTTAQTSAVPPGPHDSPHDRPAASREVAAHKPTGGAPAAAVQQAALLPRAEPGLGAASILQGDAIDPAKVPAGEHRAAHQDTGATPVPVDMPSDSTEGRQEWACWMASTAAREGLPPALPVMMALAQSGLRNLPGESEVGFFGLDSGSADAPPGFGVDRDTRPDGDWWAANPDAQLDHVVGRLSSVGGGIRTEGLDDPEALARWASDSSPAFDADRLAEAHTAAGELVEGCRQEHAAPAVHSGTPLSLAKGELGQHEFGENAGPRVNQYLAGAGVGSGNPWCASFVNWSLQQAGHDLPGTGWAAVATWVDAAQSGEHGLQIVDASAARPGDIVAYDWGGQSDFGADGHIGFLESTVDGGRFTAVEGNAQDAVTRMERNLDMGNVAFIRFTG